MDPLSIAWVLFTYGSAAAVTILLALSVILYVVTSPYPEVERSEEEETFNDPITGKRNKFPSIKDQFEVNISVVVPAYNEEERLPSMLDEALEFLENRVKTQPLFRYEVIVVSDGSRDNTVQIAEAYGRKYGCDKVRCLELRKNRGKGGAVRLGVQSSRGATILFADADGASKFEDLTKLEAALSDLVKKDLETQPGPVSDEMVIVIGSRAHLEKESLATRSVFSDLVKKDLVTYPVSDEMAIGIGSRAHLEKESLATRTIFRSILMYGFHFLVWLLTVRGVKDTQCGFKLFTRRSADTCFSSLHVNRWAFDVELLYIAQRLRIPIAEIPVRWTEIEGSKVTPIISWIQMGYDITLIWLRYRIGAWKIRSQKLE